MNDLKRRNMEMEEKVDQLKQDHKRQVDRMETDAQDTVNQYG